jgi:phosphoketolase
MLSSRPMDQQGNIGGCDAFAAWREGYGVISHTEETQRRIAEVSQKLAGLDDHRRKWVMDKFAAADRLASAAMWLVVHMTYANRIDFSGRPLAANDFKPAPEGHTGGALNMVPAYVGYMLANVLSGKTRAWVMGQGHCVAAIEAVNVLVGNLLPEQAQRYGGAVVGLTRLIQDFYSYETDARGRPAAPIGSHVNAYTAGGVVEGGYLGFVETQYVHMPLKGESLVAFLSDGAFEEQRGADWAPRWWRYEDCGLVSPIMILNGRRIEERCEIEQEGGAQWLAAHLRLSGFDPIEIDGRDPAAFAWVILEMEDRLSMVGASIAGGIGSYPAPLPYAIASTTKGYGFPGAGTNRAHNLPLSGNPRDDGAARLSFNRGADCLRVPFDELTHAVAMLATHEAQCRPRERDHALARRNVSLATMPEPAWLAPEGETSPMDAVDGYFVRLLEANQHLRPRLGNPDELKSNHMGRTLALLKHRVNRVEAGSDEAVHGAIITALNEEAVIGAALGNKGGISLAVSYEAFAVKMLGALRQEIIFARHQKEAGRAAGWLGMPLIATSHTWENGKNEQSHQDPAISEALLNEMSDVSRVLFPVDGNSAVEALRSIYRDHGVIGCLIIPKRKVSNWLTASQSREGQLGAITVIASDKPVLQFVSIGAYQLEQAALAHARLKQRGIFSTVTAVIEPGRLREPRDQLERDFVQTDQELAALFPENLPRVIITHTHPEPMTGLLTRINGGPSRWRAHGYRNQGGTLDAHGMLFANGCSWAHLVQSAAILLGRKPSDVLMTEELDAIGGHGRPQSLFV